MRTKKIISLILALCFFAGLFPVVSCAAFSGSDKIVIALDPGHGGASPGTELNGVGEKVYNFKLAGLIKKYLDENGSFITYLTRSGDYDLQLCERAMAANDVNADILISIHFDGSADPYQNGVTVYTSVFDQYALMTLGSSVASAVSSAVGLSSNGVRRKADDEFFWNSEKQWDIKDPSLGVAADYYGVIAWSSRFGMRSMIVEHGFMSNAYDKSIIAADGTLEKMARAEADAIIAYYTGHTHTYAAARRDFPSNCTFQGKQSEHCTVCDHRRNVTMLPEAKDNHYWVTTSYTPASCGVDGSVTMECRITSNLIEKKHPVENHVKTEVIPAPTQHNYVVTSERAATHTVDGYRTYSCSYCFSGYTETLKAEGHSWEFVSYTAPTCTEGGGNLYRCSKCGEEYLEAESALGHKYTVSDEVLPTCTEGGHRTSQCGVCSFVLEEELSPLGHDTALCEKKDATCAEDGYVKGKCAVCSADIDEVTKASGHDFDVSLTKEATCTEDGTVEKVCKVCGEIEADVTKAAGHKWEVVSVVEPTCSNDGKNELLCSACGEKSFEVLEKKEHSWGVESERMPGVFKAGERIITCSACGAQYVEPLTLPVTKRAACISALITATLFLLSSAVFTFFFIRKKRTAKATPLHPEEPLLLFQKK